MADRRKVFRAGSVVWALILGVGVIMLGGSILLPSTKRARLDFRSLHDKQADAPAATAPATQP